MTKESYEIVREVIDRVRTLYVFLCYAYLRFVQKGKKQMSKILRVENVTKYYGTKDAMVKAVDNVNLFVEDGDFVAIMGASGSGKSTLLNMISTIDNPSAGRIYLDDRELGKMSEKELACFRRDSLGFIFQDYNLLDTLTVRENILLPTNLRKEKESEASEKMLDLAKRLEIENQIDKMPSQISGGQKQRTAIARALITNPKIILADEPTGALDSANTKSLMQTFVKLNEELHTTILMVTHDAMVGSYASRVLFLKDGKIWNELYRGDRPRQIMYNEIINAMSILGGEADVR